MQTFHFGQFEFTLYDKLQSQDVCRYVVKQGDQEFRTSFVGIDCAVDAKRSRMSTLFISCGSAYNMTFCFGDMPSLSYPTPTAVPVGCFA